MGSGKSPPMPPAPSKVPLKVKAPGEGHDRRLFPVALLQGTRLPS